MKTIKICLYFVLLATVLDFKLIYAYFYGMSVYNLLCIFVVMLFITYLKFKLPL